MDVPTIRASLASSSTTDEADAARTLGAAIGQVIVATCAVVDPDLVILGGPLGGHPALLDTARSTAAALVPLSRADRVG